MPKDGPCNEHKTYLGARRRLGRNSLQRKAQDGDIAAGHAFAREACEACQLVEPEEASPREK